MDGVYCTMNLRAQEVVAARDPVSVCIDTHESIRFTSILTVYITTIIHWHNFIEIFHRYRHLNPP